MPAGATHRYLHVYLRDVNRSRLDERGHWSRKLAPTRLVHALVTNTSSPKQQHPLQCSGLSCRKASNCPNVGVASYSVLAACSAMQNLREAIAGYRSRLAQETNERKRDALLAVALEYLERCAACHWAR